MPNQKNSEDLLLASSALSHLDIQVTKRYLQQTSQFIEEAIEKAFGR